jgi:hypothetical protein
MSNGIGPNPLNPLSKIYLEQIAEKKDDTYLEPDMKKRQKNNEKARKDMEKMGTSMKNPHFEEVEQVNEIIDPKGAARIDAAKKKNKVDVFAYDRKLQAQGKLKGKKLPPPPTNESLDPVGKEDGDVNNDGKKDSTDSYLMKRRKAIGKAMKKRMSEGVRDEDPEKGTKERKARLEKKRGMKLDDHPQYKKEDVDNVDEMYKALPKEKMQRQTQKAYDKEQRAVAAGDEKEVNKQMQRRIAMTNPSGRKSALMKKSMKEAYSSWRQDLSEIMTDDIDSKPIKEKNVKNKIKINPKLGEAVEEMGGELIEMTEISEYDFMVEGLRQELVDEGHDPEAVDHALEEAKVTMGHDTEGPKSERTRDKLKKKAKGFLGKIAYKGYHAARDAKRAVSPMVQRIKTSAKRGMRKAALKVADKLKEENVDEAVYGGGETPKKSEDKRMVVTNADKKGNTPAYQKMMAGDKRYKSADHMGEEMSPQEVQMQKKKAMLDKMIAQRRRQELDKSKAEPTKAMGEAKELSIADQMRISREAAAKRKPYQPGDREKQRAAQLKQMAKNAPKDTRTDAQKMTDATGPRPGSRYRGD